MKQYNQTELDAKIESFLARKFQKYPEFSNQPTIVEKAAVPSLRSQLSAMFSAPKPLTTH